MIPQSVMVSVPIPDSYCTSLLGPNYYPESQSTWPETQLLNGLDQIPLTQEWIIDQGPFSNQRLPPLFSLHSQF